MTTNQTIDGVPSKCRACGSTSLSWFAQNTVPNGIQQNRLNTHDVQCVFVLGCDHCSETLKIISADKIADHFNKPAAQPNGDTVAVVARWSDWSMLTLEIDGQHRTYVEACKPKRPQGDPVAWLGSGIPFLRLEDATEYASYKDKRVTALYAEQPAPVAVVIDDNVEFEKWWMSTPILRKQKIQIAQEAWFARANLSK